MGDVLCRGSVMNNSTVPAQIPETGEAENGWTPRGDPMTSDEYGAAYQNGYEPTVRFLVSRGLSRADAEEMAQEAWAKGWERLWQLRQPQMVRSWINSIALNIHRGMLRRKQRFEELREIGIPPRVNLAAIDLARILQPCRAQDRLVLQRHYLDGLDVREIASRHDLTAITVRVRMTRARQLARARAEAATGRLSKAA